MSTNFNEKISWLTKRWEQEQCGNLVLLRGTIDGEIEIFHAKYDTYYRVNMSVRRNSGQEDYLPVMIRTELIEENTIQEGMAIEVEGTYRSRNITGRDGRNHLDLYIFANKISKAEDAETNNENVVLLEGYTTKETQLRVTPLGRVIVDMILKNVLVNGKRNYIPCVAWGDTAKKISGKPKGTYVKLIGRIQSRTYIKKYNDPMKEDEVKVAYEISVREMYSE